MLQAVTVYRLLVFSEDGDPLFALQGSRLQVPGSSATRSRRTYLPHVVAAYIWGQSSGATGRIGNLGFRSPLRCAVISLHVTSVYRARCLCRDAALDDALA